MSLTFNCNISQFKDVVDIIKSKISYKISEPENKMTVYTTKKDSISLSALIRQTISFTGSLALYEVFSDIKLDGILKRTPIEEITNQLLTLDDGFGKIFIQDLGILAFVYKEQNTAYIYQTCIIKDIEKAVSTITIPTDMYTRNTYLQEFISVFRSYEGEDTIAFNEDDEDDEESTVIARNINIPNLIFRDICIILEKEGFNLCNLGANYLTNILLDRLHIINKTDSDGKIEMATNLVD